MTSKQIARGVRRIECRPVVWIVAAWLVVRWIMS